MDTYTCEQCGKKENEFEFNFADACENGRTMCFECLEKMEVKEKAFETDYTNEMVCPYCGEEQSDSQEYFRDANNGDCVEEIPCQKCEREFKATIDFEVTYSTEKSTIEVKD